MREEHAVTCGGLLWCLLWPSERDRDKLPNRSDHKISFWFPSLLFFFLMKISHQNPLTLCLYPESARKLQHLQEQGHSSLTPPCVWRGEPHWHEIWFSAEHFPGPTCTYNHWILIAQCWAAFMSLQYVLWNVLHSSPSLFVPLALPLWGSIGLLLLCISSCCLQASGSSSGSDSDSFCSKIHS